MLHKKHRLKRLELDNSCCLKVETYPNMAENDRNKSCLLRAWSKHTEFWSRMVETYQILAKTVETSTFGRECRNIK